MATTKALPRPKKRREGKTVTIDLRMPLATLAVIDELVGILGETREEVMEHILREHLFRERLIPQKVSP